MPETTRTELIRPAEPTGAPPWVLTGLDRANLWLVLRGTWLFDEALDADRLRGGLARLLTSYPQLAGRMRRGEQVEATGEGVPFELHARPALTRAQLAADPAQAAGLRAPFDRGAVKRGRQAPLAVRLTELADGHALAVTAYHALLDGASFYTLVRNWGLACAEQPFPAPLVDQQRMTRAGVRDRDAVQRAALAEGWRRPALLRGLPVMLQLAVGRLNRRVGPFHLDDEALARLRRRAQDGAPADALSTNDVLTAHLSLQCARLYGHGPETRCGQIVVLDARRRMRDVPPAFTGNASLSAPGATFTADEPLGALAARTHHALAPYLAVPSAATEQLITLAREAMEHRLFLMPFDISAMHGRRPTLTYVNNFTRLPVYDVDFGTPDRPRRPWRVIPHDLPDPVVFWPAPPRRGGVELYLTGSPATASGRMSPGDPWWDDLLARV